MRSDIISWNPINTRTSALHASIYIKPTLEVLDFFNRSPNHKAVVKIGGTSSCYDDQNMFAIIEKSSDVPNKRDNFYNSTGLYVIVLNTLWYGFPLKNGYVEYQEGIVDNIIDYVSKCNKQDMNKLNKNAKDASSNTSKETKQEQKDELKQEQKDENKQENKQENKEIKETYKELPNRHNRDRKSFDKTVLIMAFFALVLILIVLYTSNPSKE